MRTAILSAITCARQKQKRWHYSIQELMEVDSGVVFEDCEWEDVDAWTELLEV